MKKKYVHVGWAMLIPLIAACFVGGTRLAGETAETLKETVPAVDTAGPESNSGDMSPMFKGIVSDVIRAGNHVYIQVETGEKRAWVAVPAFAGCIGDDVLVPPGVPVADFQSKTLGRKFDMIYFVGDVRIMLKHGEAPPE